MLFKRHRLALAIITPFILSGCIPENLDTTIDENVDTNSETIEAPELTMDLPVTLSGVVSHVNASQKAAAQKPGARSSDPGECEYYFDPHSNFMENGFAMSRFLVGLSQQQSCFADFIMASIVAQGSIWVNKGLISLPVNADDPGAPSHVQIDKKDGTTQVWLYFSTAGQDLPEDKSGLQALYLTWSEVGDDINGQFFMVNMPQNPQDPDAPEGIRVDFTRSASGATNKIYLDMRSGHSAGMGGFRIDVTQTGSGDTATYEAKGLISFLGQPFPDLPEDLDFPEFAAAAVVDANGLGASSANFNKFAVSLVNDVDGDGIVEPVNQDDQQEFDLGTYQFNINDTTYFDPSLFDSTNTDTPFVEQVTEWRNKSVSDADYVAGYGIIEPAVPAGLENYTMLKCLERDFCDYNNNGIQDGDEWDGWSLGEGYFTNTCFDQAGIAGNDCTDFVNGFFQQDLFGVGKLNSDAADEPGDDWRKAKLEQLGQLTSVIPDGETGQTTFDFPDPSE